ncbi:MAG: hypothetical protein ACD_22C00214G0005 [uncultured bacterium]|nr:MAG: hypothetical protein ACD_22C00214G0005 [uncultured bacterium]
MQEESVQQPIDDSPSKRTNLEPNVIALISYLPFLGGIFIYLSEKENKFIRFHALQSLIFWVGVVAASGIVEFLKIIAIGYFLVPLLQVAVVGLWFFLMYKAYKKEEWELPILGKIAKDHIYR